MPANRFITASGPTTHPILNPGLSVFDTLPKYNTKPESSIDFFVR